MVLADWGISPKEMNTRSTRLSISVSGPAALKACSGSAPPAACANCDFQPAAAGEVQHRLKIDPEQHFGVGVGHPPISWHGLGRKRARKESEGEEAAEIS
ncbi:MAG: hypothetical protein WDN31_11095 [Hyphomicrobium sp.]